MIRPEVTLYGWRNVKILQLNSSFQRFVWLFSWLHFGADLFWGACSADVAASGRVISLIIINRWWTSSRSPSVSPHYCFTSGVKFLHGEESAVIHRMKNYLLYKDPTCLVFSEYCFLELLARPSSIRTLLLSGFDSLLEKLQALQRCHLSVFSECCFLEPLAWPSSIRTLLSGFDSLLEKVPALQTCHLSRFSECCLLELFY